MYLADGPHPNSRSQKRIDDASAIPVPTRPGSLHPAVAALRDDEERLVMSPAPRCRSLFSIHGGADDLVETGSVGEARAKWEARMEGKDADMQDGDVVEFRHGKASGDKAVS